MIFITEDVLNSARFESIPFGENFEITFNWFPLGLQCSQIFTSQNSQCVVPENILPPHGGLFPV